MNPADIAGELQKDVGILDTILHENHGPHTLARVGAVRLSLTGLIAEIDKPPGPSPPPTPEPQPVPQPTPNPPTVTGFRGVIAFGDSKQIVTGPGVVAGRVLHLWSDIEKTQGHYDFSGLLAQCQQWINAGKKVAIRIQTAMPHTAATPDWLLSLTGHVQGPNSGPLPVYWHQAFIDARKALAIQAETALQPIAQHIAFYEIPLGIYAESKVDASSSWNGDGHALLAGWQAQGYTDDIWFAAMKSLVNNDVMALQHLGFPLVVAVEQNTFSEHTKQPRDLVNWLRSVLVGIPGGVWPENHGYNPGQDISIFTAGGPNLQESQNPAGSGNLMPVVQGIVHSGGTYAVIFDGDITHANLPALQFAEQSISGAPPSPEPTPAPVPTPVPSPTPAPIHPGFRGVFNFPSGHVDPTGPVALANNPDLAGTLLYYPWAEVEANPNSLDVQRILQDAKPWTDAGKKFAVRIMGGMPNRQAFPSWIGVGNVGGYPIYWDPKYLEAVQQLAAQLGAAFDGHPHVSWIQIGLGVFGESKVEQTHAGQSPDLAAWQAAGYTDQVWLDTMKTICEHYKAAITRTPLAAAVNASFIGGSGMHGGNVVAMLTDLGIMPQNDGWRVGSTLSPEWQHATAGAVIEQFLSSSGSAQNDPEKDLRSIVELPSTGQLPSGAPVYALIYDSDLLKVSPATLQWAFQHITP